MDGALTPSDPVYIWLAIIQLVAMVLLPLQWRGLGENVLLGKQRSVQAHMEMRKNDSPAAACQVGHTIFNISVNTRVCLFYSFSVFLRLCAQLYIWGWGGGRRLQTCMAADMFVSATMRHIQHMLPSSSPFRGRLNRDTQQDSLT